MSKFQEKEWESDDHTMFTFSGHNGNFCINLNGECIHSVKTLGAHIKKRDELIQKYNLKEIQP